MQTASTPVAVAHDAVCNVARPLGSFALSAVIPTRRAAVWACVKDPEAGVGLRELAAYYAPLDLWRALRRAGAETRDTVARSSNMPLATVWKSTSVSGA